MRGVSKVSAEATDPDAPFALSLLRVPEVLNEDVRTRKDLGLVPVIPAYEVGGRSMVAEHLHDLAVTLRLPLVVSPDHQAITRACVQR